ncbi:hypothetical protein KIPB_016062, partial [Kipferlia bialata]
AIPSIPEYILNPRMAPVLDPQTGHLLTRTVTDILQDKEMATVLDAVEGQLLAGKNAGEETSSNSLDPSLRTESYRASLSLSLSL